MKLHQRTNHLPRQRPLIWLLAALGSLAALHLTSLAAELPTAAPEQVGMSPERLERIGIGMQRYIDRGEVPGTVTLVMRRGHIVHFEARGYRDAESKAPLEKDAIFRIASMTKPIVSVAAMMLYEEGHFLLTDPISKWLPEFSNPQVQRLARHDERTPLPFVTEPARNPINVEHILTHTAGLANSYRGFLQPEYTRTVEGRASPDETVADTIRRLAAMPLNNHPGEAWEYSRATCVVGRLVEEISGQTLDEFLRERIFQPLEMNDTYFYLPEDKVSRFTSLYRPGDENKIALVETASAESRFVKEPHKYFMGSGGLVSTASDYARFLSMLAAGGELDGKRILSPTTIQLMTESHTGDLPLWLPGPGFGFGLGFGVVTDQAASNLPWSEGTYTWGGAFCTYFWVDPERELIGILMTQVRPYAHLNIRSEFVVLATQAVVE